MVQNKDIIFAPPYRTYLCRMEWKEISFKVKTFKECQRFLDRLESSKNIVKDVTLEDLGNCIKIIYKKYE